jgi:hypothetical protein
MAQKQLPWIHPHPKHFKKLCKRCCISQIYYTSYHPNHIYWKDVCTTQKNDILFAMFKAVNGVFKEDGITHTITPLGDKYQFNVIKVQNGRVHIKQVHLHSDYNKPIGFIQHAARLVVIDIDL